MDSTHAHPQDTPPAEQLVTDHDASLLDEHATATFSADRVYRYALTRRWDAERPMACFVMLNPSTADAFQVDPTVRRCIGFARAWKAGGLLVLNLFALRSTDPRALYGHADPVGSDNDAVIARYLAGEFGPVGPVVAAWGAHGGLSQRDEVVRGLLRSRCTPVCLALTKGGHPQHPLYVPASKVPVAFDGEA